MTPTTEQPNILLLCTDQQRFDALGAAGNPHIDTPHLDRLAAEGALFENCYVQSPVCGPSRASLMTGRYVPSHGLWANGVDLPAHERLFTRELADAGYDAGLVGKLHLGSCHGGRTEPRLDDGLRVFRWAHDPYPGSSENAYHRWLAARHPDLHARALREGPGAFDALPAEAHYSHWIAEETIGFLRHAAEGTGGASSPFVFLANFFDPHHGFGAPQEYLDRYDSSGLPAPVTRPGELESKPPIQAEASAESYAGHARGYLEYSEQELAETVRAYYAMVSLLDDEVGRILAVLEETGQAENTIVVFTSDHGEMLGDHQLMLKGPFLYEGAVRVPLIVRWPGVTEPGTRRTELAQWVDLAPTFLEAAAAPVPRAMQGSSLLPLLRGDEDVRWRDWALCQYRDSGHPYDSPALVTMLRTGQWKLVVHHGEPATDRERTGELYDLAADPRELTNLWAEAGHAATRLALQETLLDVMVATEDRTARRVDVW
ncbi:sulfatase-like hydrolase/transferase [Brachybacterium sacelli]|uniref:Arylsulfatase A-like enzyme n=1 Tax=Brachybacterium sacelli TaxID=173364 RepID=A0ABS4X6Q3_9MICO|nr:sulfatase-like hydrolase/transferase [Brachybacterium sacelli]MBP2384119.1 arylsulfatase A-like enzyme [Brachybacterium sacelli]